MSDEPHNRKRKVRRGEDVSEREHAEETLQTTLQRLRALVSSMHGSVLLVAEDRVELANQAFCDYFGLKDAPADLVGLTAARMIQRIKNAYLDPDNQTSRIAEIVRRGRPVTGEEIAMRDGRVCLRDFVPISVDGTSHGRLWYHVDITERKQAEKALHESEERYRTLLESAPDAILVHRNGELLYANPVAVALYGASSLQELSQHNILDLVPSGEAHLAVERTKKVQSGRKLPIREGRIVRLDGREVPVEVVSSPVEYRGGTAAQAMIRDTTDRKHAHAEIESLARFPGENPNPVLRVSRYGVLMYANQASQAWLEDWGCAVGEMAPEVLRSLVDKAFAKRRPKPITVDIGLYGQIWAFQIVPIASAGYANVYGRDITERRRAEEALRESEARAASQAEYLRTILETAPAIVWVAEDRDCTVISGNQASDELLRVRSGTNVSKSGPRPAELRHYRVFHAGVELAPEELPVQRVAASGKPLHNYAFDLLFDDGEKRSLEGNVAPLFDATGEPSGSVAVFTDVTDRLRAEEAQRESEASYRRIVETAQEGIMTADTEGVITFANAKMAEMLGYSVRELIGKPGAFLIDRSDPAAVTATAARIEKGKSGQSEHYEARWLRKDGSELWVYASGTPIYDFNGNHAGNLMMCADITDRKRTEEALRESQQRLSTIVDSIADGFYALDRDWRITHINDATLGYFRKKRGEMLGRNLVELFPAVAGSDFEREFRWAMASGEPAHFEARSVVFGDRTMDMHAYPGPDVLTVLFRDVTARKQAEEAVRLQANALQAAANGIVITDPHGTIQWVNGAFTRLTGYSFEEATGQNPRVLKSGQHDKAFYDKLWKTILAGRVWQGEIVNKRKDGRLYTEEMTITPVRDDAGQTAHFIAIKQDVTERKRLEAELERTRTEFLGEVSHELKTPLTAIKGCAAMALSAPVPPDAAETRELFDIIDAQANRLTDLVANLLDVTRIEGRRLSIEPTVTDLAGIVEEARVIFEHSQYPHPLEVMLPRELPVLRADARRVVQVLTNLFTNAAKYSAPTTPIIVTAEKGEGVVTVHVRDAGVGIAAEKMPLLFRKFVQVQERGVKGTGLGLFICKGIVEAHGGRIWAESDGKGKGTVFSFTLPAVAGKMAPKHKGVAAGRGGVGRRTAERPFRIVAVDDEPDILHYIEHCLRSANCEVISTSDPLAAAELVRFHAPDIVLLDMRMPGMSGLEVLEEIRKFCQTPVTFITATQNREDVVRGREFGGTTWLEKPFSPQQLLDHVGLVLARRRRR